MPRSSVASSASALINATWWPIAAAVITAAIATASNPARRAVGETRTPSDGGTASDGALAFPLTLDLRRQPDFDGAHYMHGRPTEQ